MNRQILVVDASPGAGEYYQETLAPHRFEVTHTADGRQALEQLARQPPDLLIADLVVGSMAGLQLLESVRQDLHLFGLRVMVVTGMPLDLFRARLDGLLVMTYLSKPVRPPELLVISAKRSFGLPLTDTEQRLFDTL